MGVQVKTCTICNRELPLAEFHNGKLYKEGKYHYCKRRAREKDRQWKLANPERWNELVRRGHLKHQYGITPENYTQLLLGQGGVCAICSAPPGVKRLGVDHDHKTGRVRGILCDLCNTAIGQLGDSPQRLYRAAEYLGGRE